MTTNPRRKTVRRWRRAILVGLGLAGVLVAVLAVKTALMSSKQPDVPPAAPLQLDVDEAVRRLANAVKIETHEQRSAREPFVLRIRKICSGRKMVRRMNIESEICQRSQKMVKLRAPNGFLKFSGARNPKRIPSPTAMSL